MPPPAPEESVRNTVTIVRWSGAQKPVVPSGFEVSEFASGLDHSRLIRVAPNGDVFAAESAAGRIHVLRPDGARPAQASVFASGLLGPFGIAFYLPGANPEWVYIGNTDSVVRFPYRSGDVVARGPAEIIVPHLPVGGHRTRDVVFSQDGRTMYVSVAPARTSLREWQSSARPNCRHGNPATRSAPPGGMRPTAPTS
jgi:glucose/arabinose dehydrogenase